MEDDWKLDTDDSKEDLLPWRSREDLADWVEDLFGPNFRPSGSIQADEPSPKPTLAWDNPDDDPENNPEIFEALANEFQEACGVLLKYLNAGIIPFRNLDDIDELSEGGDVWCPYVKTALCQFPSESVPGKIVLSLGQEQVVFYLNSGTWGTSMDEAKMPVPLVVDLAHPDDSIQKSSLPTQIETSLKFVDSRADLKALSSSLEYFLRGEIGLLLRIGFTPSEILAEFDSLANAIFIQDHLIKSVARYEGKPENYIKSTDFESCRQFQKWVHIGHTLPQPIQQDWFFQCRKSVLITTLADLGIGFDQAIDSLWNKYCSSIILDPVRD
jgi:hypothetical protein